jgi:hypothetical protein
MTFATLWAFLAIALPILASLLAPLSSVDLAYHLRAGAEFLDSGRIATTDTWTFTVAGEPWLNQQWAAQAFLAGVYRIGGWTGLVVLRAIVAGAISALVFVALRRQGLDERRAAWLTLAAFGLSAVAMALRPQLFGMLLFALAVLVVVERRRHPRLLWLAPLVVLVWANVHGSFFLGPVVLGLAWLHDLHDRWPGARWTIAAAVVAALAACVTPFGAAVWSYAAGLSTNPGVTERITEWQPTSLRSPVGIAFFASALLLVAALARRARATSWPALLWFGAFFLVGAWAVRGAAWWPTAAAVGFGGLIGSGFLGSGATEKPPDPARRAERPSRVNVVLAAALVVAGVALLPVWRPTEIGLGAPQGVVGNAPPAITVVLRETTRAGDRIYQPQPWGSWFELAVPDATVVLDSRFELFPEPVWADYEAVASGRADWRAILDRWGVTIVVATNERVGGFLEQIRADPGWRVLHSDADGDVLVRADRPA